jgi:acetolactate synthase-1/2/3 large subunit
VGPERPPEALIRRLLLRVATSHRTSHGLDSGGRGDRGADGAPVRLDGQGNAHLISHLTSRGFPFTSARHEAATVAMADAWHRATGRIAAATTTYGAGFTGTCTALAEAHLARIPLVLVTGDAPTTGRRAFDIDQTAAAVQTVQPVVLVIPYDQATAPLTDPVEPQPLPAKPTWTASAEELDRIAGLLRAAERPLLLAGRGVVLADAAASLRELGDRLGALFMTSVMATNAVDSPWDLASPGAAPAPSASSWPGPRTWSWSPGRR